MGARYSGTSGYSIARRTRTARPTVRTVQQKVKLGPTAAKVIGFGILAVLAVLMLASSSKSNTSLYDQTKTRQDISQVEQDIQRLKLEASREQSLQAVQQSSVKDQMVPATDVQYIEKGEVAGAATAKP